jgi:hypothetical protein
MSQDLRPALTGITLTLHTVVRPTDTTARVGSQAESSSAQVRGSTAAGDTRIMGAPMLAAMSAHADLRGAVSSDMVP